jgi:hypothetical protein
MATLVDLPQTDLPGAPTPSTAAVCDTCGHLITAHDVIGVRYCRATLENALARTCICKGV